MALSGTLNTGSYDGRYYQFSWTATQSVANNRSTISWTLKAVGGNDSWYAERTLKLYAAGSYLVNKTDRVERYTGTVSSGTFYIDHDSDGTTNFSVSMQAAVYVSTVNCTASKTFSLNQIARTSSLTASNGTLGTAQTLTITEQDSSFVHKITYSCGSASGYAAGSSSATTTSNSISWTPPLSLASQNTTGTSVSVKLTLYTYTSGGTQIGSTSKTITCSIPSSVKPSVSFTVSDAAGYSGTYGGYVQGLSKIKVTITASGSYSSTIKSYKTTADGSTYTSSTFTTDVIKGTGTLTVSVTVTDSRGRTNSASKTITSLAYTKPALSSLKAIRCLSDGTAYSSGGYLKLTFNSTVSSLNSKNTAAYVLKYKKESETSYTSVTLSSYANKYSVSSGSAVFAADTGSSYDISLTVTDAFNATTRTTNGPSSVKIFSILAQGLGIAIGKIAELTDYLDIGFKTLFRQNVYLKNNITLCGETTDGTNCSLIYMNSSNNTIVGYGGYINAIGSTNIYGNQMSIRTNGSIYINDRAYGTNVVLWSGALYMSNSHTITLSASIKSQPHGIVLVFSAYDTSAGSALNNNFQYVFIPKYHVIGYSGGGVTVFLTTHNTSTSSSKYLYISDTSIVGHANNNTTTVTNNGSGITTNQRYFVLRNVVGV